MHSLVIRLFDWTWGRNNVTHHAGLIKYASAVKTGGPGVGIEVFFSSNDLEVIRASQFEHNLPVSFAEYFWSSLRLLRAYCA